MNYMNNDSIKRLLIAGALVALPFFAMAEDIAAPSAKKAINQVLRQQQQTLQQEAKAKKEALQAEVKAKREALQVELKTKRDAVITEMKTKRQEFEQKAKERVENLKKKLGEERAKRVEQLFNNMARKFEAAIDRLNKTADRIDALLKKASASGKDVSKQMDILTAARGKISAVETALQGAKAQFAAMAQSADTKTAFNKVKELIRGVEQKVKEAHAALVDVVKSIKGLKLGEDRATTTPSQ